MRAISGPPELSRSQALAASHNPGTFFQLAHFFNTCANIIIRTHFARKTSLSFDRTKHIHIECSHPAYLYLSSSTATHLELQLHTYTHTHTYPPTHHGFCSPSPPTHRLARRPSHPQRRRPPSPDPLRPRLRPGLHVARRSALQDRRPCEELLRHLPLRPRRGARF